MQHAPAFLALVEGARKQIQECTVYDVGALQARGEPFHLVDVREDDEWRAGRAAGAIHLGKGVIERDIEARIPAREATIVLYCGGGYRSALAAQSLQAMGYRSVLSLQGGIKAWRDAGLPEEK